MSKPEGQIEIPEGVTITTIQRVANAREAFMEIMEEADEDRAGVLEERLVKAFNEISETKKIPDITAAMIAMTVYFIDGLVAQDITNTISRVEAWDMLAFGITELVKAEQRAEAH